MMLNPLYWIVLLVGLSIFGLALAFAEYSRIPTRRGLLSPGLRKVMAVYRTLKKNRG